MRAWLDAVRSDPRCRHIEHLAPRPARTATLHGRPLPPAVAAAVPTEGLWSHQAAALDALRHGRSVVLATPTASGKSLVARLAVAEAACAPLRPATSLLLFPTKALAQDQLRAFDELGVAEVEAGTYDGDCTPDERRRLRDHANVVLTNPEMLHHGMLPNHRRWATFLGRLRYVVVDEAHALGGVFGSHVAHLLRRLTRVAHRYGADPTFLCSSATIGEPARFASSLCGRDVIAIDLDGSPRGAKHVIAWDPTAGVGSPRSTHAATVEVAASLLDAGMRTLVFCRSRSGTEVVADALRQRLVAGAARVRSYRGGYLPEERRGIEADLAAGTLDAVVSTSALELGVDISGLDAVVMSGFPGTVASMWQQIGRCGRGSGESLAVIVAGRDQLDRWVVRHPAEVFGRPPEPAVINPANPQVVEAQLACASRELPLAPDDDRYWGDALDDVVRRGVRDGWLSLRRRGPHLVRAVWSGDGVPSARVGLRSSGRGEHRIVEIDGTPIGTVDDDRLYDQTHPDAIYLHQGRAWRVCSIDEERREVLVVPDRGDTTTHPRSQDRVAVVHVDATATFSGGELTLGWVEIAHRVTGYQTREAATRRLLCEARLDLPARESTTRAILCSIDESLLTAAEVAPDRVRPALHAVEHAVTSVLPTFAMCDRRDIEGVSSAALGEGQRGGFVVFDRAAGGSGIVDSVWGATDRLFEAALAVLEDCECNDGCPSCVQSPTCGRGNEGLDKPAATRLIRAIVEAPPIGSALDPGDESF